MEDATQTDAVSSLESMTLHLINRLSGSSPPSSSTTAESAPVTSIDIYQIGRLLQHLETQQGRHDQTNDNYRQHYNHLQEAYQQLVDGITTEHCDAIFNSLASALQELLLISISDPVASSADAVAAVAALVSLSEAAAQSLARTSMVEDVIRLLWSDRGAARRKVAASSATAVFQILSSILPHLEQPEVLLHTLQSLHEEDETLWLAFLESQSPAWRERLVRTLGDDDTSSQDYVRSLLFPEPSAFRHTPQVAPPSAPFVHRQGSTTVAPPRHERNRRIQLVQQVLPHLGPGFVEAVLAYYQGDVERTVAVLLEAESTDGPSPLPSALQELDRQLPRMRVKSRGAQAFGGEDDGDEDDSSVEEMKTAALARTKAMVQEANAQAERESWALQVVMASNDDVYNDDYDDQWDNDHDYDAPDVGLYDNDDDARGRPTRADTQVEYQNILLYNRALKQVEADDSFWQENANTNRMARGSAAAEPERKYRGPDKLRGGRIPKTNQEAGRGAPGRGRGAKEITPRVEDAQGTPHGQTGTTAASGNGVKGAPKENADDNKPFSRRRKENHVARRKDRQKQAMAKRSG